MFRFDISWTVQLPTHVFSYILESYGYPIRMGRKRASIEWIVFHISQSGEVSHKHTELEANDVLGAQSFVCQCETTWTQAYYDTSSKVVVCTSSFTSNPTIERVFYKTPMGHLRFECHYERDNSSSDVYELFEVTRYSKDSKAKTPTTLKFGGTLHKF